MPNKIFSQPPLQTDLLSKNVKERLHEYWSSWFNELHYLLSNRSWQNITMAGEVELNAQYVALTTTSAGYAITLAAPTQPKARMMIEMIARGGAFDVTMSLANCEGGTAATTCTWNSVGDTLMLESKSNKWVIYKENGVVLT